MGIVTWGLHHLSKMTVHQRRELKSEFGGNLYRAGNPIARTVRLILFGHLKAVRTLQTCHNLNCTSPTLSEKR